MLAKVLLLGKLHTWVDWAVIVALWNILGPKKSLINKGLLGNENQFVAEKANYAKINLVMV